MIAVLMQSVEDAMARMQRTPLIVDGTRIFTLQELLSVLQHAGSEQIEWLSHNDVISSWLDQKGYSELAEALRPIHGEGPALREAISGTVEEWMNIYEGRSASPGKPGGFV